MIPLRSTLDRKSIERDFADKMLVLVLKSSRLKDIENTWRDHD